MRKILVRTPGVNWKSGFQTINGFMEKMQRKIQQMAEQDLQAELEDEADGIVGREPHERRSKQGHGTSNSGVCQKCGSRQRRDFVRNGRRRRTVATLWGVLTLWLPRVKCGSCGGSVRLQSGLLGPYQRVWDDITQRVSRWADIGLSLRQMRHELGELLKTDIGISTLNRRVQAIQTVLGPQVASVPPVLMLDAIWVTVLLPTGARRQDSRKRNRLVKRKHKLPVLVAVGVWPKTGKWEVLDWAIASAESQEDWEKLLLQMENRGGYAERGLRLIVHDRGKGLKAALNLIYPHIPHQHCVFHKLRNVFQAIAIPDGMGRKAARRLRKRIIAQAAAIFYAPTKDEALSRLQVFDEVWLATQPDAAKKLRQDLDDTLRFYALLARFPSWRPSTLRTTSLLERVNRIIRRLFRAASAFHSLVGLEVAVARSLAPFVAV